MGWVPPPPPPMTNPEARAAHRAFLVSVLGYDPAKEPRPKRQTLRFIRRYLFR